MCKCFWVGGCDETKKNYVYNIMSGVHSAGRQTWGHQTIQALINEL